MRSTPLPTAEQLTEPAEREDELPSPETAESQALIRKLVSFSRFEAWKIVGGLSNPSKMPCYAWGIPAQSCHVGSKLLGIEKSVCHACYAFRGYYRTHRVRRANERRLTHYGDVQWVEAMVKLVYWQAAESGTLHFRWFDTGDLQSVEMLRDIATVAAGTPEIRHWLPTREYGIVREYLRQVAPEKSPANLTIRVSAPLVDGPAPLRLGLPTSTVHSTETTTGFACPAYESRPASCGACRACWDAVVENISYPLH